MLRPYKLLLFATAALAACTPDRSQAPETVLANQGDSLALPYGDTGDAVWLGGHRWAVLLPSEVAILDFEKKTRTRLGTARDSLLEPITIFRQGDSLYVGDWRRRATTVWTLDGRLIRSQPVDAVVRGALPRARDAAGNFYVELRPSAGPDGSGNRDSALVLRRRSLGIYDTVARLAPIDLARVQSQSGERFERRVFSGTDKWGVRPDGTVWIARVYHNRIDAIAPDGSTKRGMPLPDRVLEVSREDRELFVRRFPPELRSTAEQLPFAPVKAPFDAVFTDDRGAVWLERSRAIVDTTQSYAVVRPDQTLERLVIVPGNDVHAIAAGDGRVLVWTREPGGIALRELEVPAAASPSSPTNQ